MARPRKLILHPASVIFPDRKEQLMVLMTVYGLTLDQARAHCDLNGLGRLYLSENSRSGSEYSVIINTDYEVPAQDLMGARVVQIRVKGLGKQTDSIPWTDLNEIKRAVAGDSVEAIEVFPNTERAPLFKGFRHIWCFPHGEVIPVGYGVKDATRDTKRKDSGRAR